MLELGTFKHLCRAVDASLHEVGLATGPCG